MNYKVRRYEDRTKFFLAKLGLLFLLQGCMSEQIVIYDDLNLCDLEVIPDWDQVESGYDLIGRVSYRDTGFGLNCGEEKIMSRIMARACDANADAVVMQDVVPPMTGGPLLGSTCYQASADLIIFETD